MAAAMTSVLVHYEFEEGDESLNLVRPVSLFGTSQSAPPALPFPLTQKRGDAEWFASLPHATRVALEHVARANATTWAGGARVPGAVATPIN